MEALGNSVERGPETWARTGVEYLFRKDVLLVRQEHAAQVRRLLRAEGMLWQDGDPAMPENTPRDGSLAYGYRAIHLRPGTTFQALAVVRDGTDRVPGFGDDVVTVDYLFHISGNGGICPADEPEPIPPGTPPDPPPSADRAAGTGIRVVVVDTGLDPQAPATHWWLREVDGDDDPLVATNPLQTYAGHGTFIAGVVRSMAPRAEVIVRHAFSKVGAQFETVLVRALDRVLFEDRPDVICMSAGTRAMDVFGPRVLNWFYETRFRRYKGVVFVVAAGNDSGRTHFWPAAAPWTVSVGALAVDWRSRADFTNFGSWVDVYAPGERLINAFPTGRYEYKEPERQGQSADFDGMASWSGTSFSTPLVAGLIAARMSATGENGPDAASALLAQARAAAQPGVGAVLLPEP
jgi:subtilisin family serine protease